MLARPPPANRALAMVIGAVAVEGGINPRLVAARGGGIPFTPRATLVADMATDVPIVAGVRRGEKALSV